MKNILVTGSDGLIGWHMRCYLLTQPDVEIVPCNRQQFNDDSYLADAVQSADAVMHFAGMNRGEEAEVARANVEIASRLVDACRKAAVRPHILYSSSTHVDGPTSYGDSKRKAGECFQAWADESGAKFSNVVLPHVFGEHGVPFYNSVVSTFCRLIADNQEPEIHNDGQLCLLHAQDVAEFFWQAFLDNRTGELRPDGQPVKVTELHRRLVRLTQRYREGTIPNLDDPIDLKLFNTWRSYLAHEDRPIDLTLHSDDRGDLFEAVRADGQGQIFMSTTHPGITRGNHFHRRKVERFLVVSGQAHIRLRKVLTEDVHTFAVSGEKLQAIDIPTLHTHNITNVGDQPLITLFWAGEHFNPDDSDTFFMEVEPGQAVNV